MKHAKKLIAFLLACLMFGSTVAFAADAAEYLYTGTPEVTDVLSEDEYAFYYDEAQYGREFDTQSVNVYLKKGVKNTPHEYRFDYSVGSGVYTGGIPITDKTDDTGAQRILVRKTVAGTRESVLAEIEQLKSNPYVYYAEPNYKLRPWMGGSTTPVETQYDIGNPNYNDLIDEWNYLRLYSGYKPEFSIKPGVLSIVLKEGTDVSGCFNEIFSELDVESVSFELRKTMSLFDNVGEKRSIERQYATVKLKDESDQHVRDVCLSLKDHPLVYGASPSYIIPVCGGETDPQPEPLRDYTLTEEELAKIYDPANYEQGDYINGRVIVGVTKNIPEGKTYADIFPNYTVDERYTKEYKTITVLNLKLPENTKEAVTEAIGALKNNSYVIYAEPQYMQHVKQTLIGDELVNPPEGVYTISPERLAEIYDPANYTEREYAPGELEICINRPVTGVRSYEELFPELEIGKIDRVFNFNQNCFIFLTLKERTKAAVLDTIRILKERSDIAYVQPVYTSGFFMEGVVAGDVDMSGEVGNSDIILTARYVVNLTEFSGFQKQCADLDGDGEITNADLIMTAQTVVGLIPSGRQLLTEDRARAMNQVFTAKHSFGINKMRYYGKYSGCEAVHIDAYSVALCVIVEVEVAGYNFAFADTASQFYIFNGDDVLRIDEAYEAGWITVDDVAAIWTQGRLEDVYKYVKVDGKWVKDEYIKTVSYI